MDWNVDDNGVLYRQVCGELFYTEIMHSDWSKLLMVCQHLVRLLYFRIE